MTPAARLAWLLCILLAAPALGQNPANPAPDPAEALLAPDNLVAWCIVPFDAARRGPRERAAMVRKLGLRRVAYDWRAEHVSSFEDEIKAYQQHGLEFFAFWSWHPDFAPLVKKYGIRPQFWITNPSPEAASQEERVRLAAEQLRPLVDQTRALGCRLGLYNHGGWGGEPQNLAAVCRRLQETVEADHVGIVYNFHHAHEHIEDFEDSLRVMLPFLLCVNLNGMNSGAQPKILSLGKGEHEEQMLRTLLESGYDGPVGILDHRPETDSEQTLQENLAGLRELRSKLSAEPAAASQTPSSAADNH